MRKWTAMAVHFAAYVRQSLVSNCSFGGLATVLLQLVMQGLEADPENLGGAGLIVVRGFERLHDEEFFGLLAGRADTEAHCVRFLYGWTRRDVSEAGRKVTRLDDGGVTDDNGAL